MAEFGAYNPFPLEFGGGPSNLEIAHQYLLERAAEQGFDTSEEQMLETELYGDAIVLGMILDANERLGLQLNPRAMLENLPVWETAMGLSPTKTASDTFRRDAVLARARAYGENTPVAVYSAAHAVFGAALVSITYPEEADAITYWPGVNPGPPGLEWTSTRMIHKVRVRREGVVGYQERVDMLASVLDELLPAQDAFTIYTYDAGADSFVLGVSELGVAGL